MDRLSLCTSGPRGQEAVLELGVTKPGPRGGHRFKTQPFQNEAQGSAGPNPLLSSGTIEFGPQDCSFSPLLVPLECLWGANKYFFEAVFCLSPALITRRLMIVFRWGGGARGAFLAEGFVRGSILSGFDMAVMRPVLEPSHTPRSKSLLVRSCIRSYCG